MTATEIDTALEAKAVELYEIDMRHNASDLDHRAWVTATDATGLAYRTRARALEDMPTVDDERIDEVAQVLHLSDPRRAHVSWELEAPNAQAGYLEMARALASVGALTPAYMEREWGRRIKDGSLGNGHLTGHVSSLCWSRRQAEEHLLADQDVVVRDVSGWRTAPPAESS